MTEQEGESTAAVMALDHLVLAVPELEAGVARVRELLGVEAVPGGRHRRWGTRNALIGLGDERYLEIIAPDPEAPVPEGVRPFGLDDPGSAKLATWAVRSPDLEESSDRIRAAGWEPGSILTGRRERPDGSVLRWRLTDPTAHRAGGLLPFFIDWLDSPHPASGLVHPLVLTSLRAECPDPGDLRRVLAGLDLRLPVKSGPRAALVATVEAKRGRLELR